ncbi:MAG: hypothetical protein ACRD4Q_10185 [Candidatus Acidiferrales bacterium]
MLIHKRFLFVTVLTALASASLWAADDPFVGTWKGTQHDSAGQVQQINNLGGNKYDWTYGDNHLTIIADGADHPYRFGGTYSMKQESPDKWVFTHKQDGRLTTVSTWTLLGGGQQWNIEKKGTRPDGSPLKFESTRTRVGTGSGFAGKWELKNETFSSAPVMIIKPYGNGGLSFRWPRDKEHQDIKFDGKDYPDVGPRVPHGSTSSAKRTDEHTIQATDKLNGKVTDTQELKVSEDDRTLTETIHVKGEQKPIVNVWKKQM